MKKSNLYGDSCMTKAKYQRIVDKITKDIKEGKLATGQKIPSVRKLAER